MKYLLSISLLFGLILCSDKDKIYEKNETLFIFFDSKDKYQIKDEYQNNKTMRHEYFTYFFIELDEYSLKPKALNLTYNEYADFDEMERENPVPTFTINKSFLKKNKDIILTRTMMHKIGFDKTINKVYKAKTIFLIEKDTLQKSKIIIKEIILSNIGEE